MWSRICFALASITAIVATSACAVRNGESSPFDTIPAANAVRASAGGFVYVADSVCNCIEIYDLAGHNQRPIGRIMSPSFSYIEALKVDANGNLWVTNFGLGTNVFEYPRGAKKPSLTLSDPGYPSGIDVVNGKVYVANLFSSTHGTGNVVVYDANASTPSHTLSDPRVTGAIGIAADTKGDIFIDTNNSPTRTLGEFALSGGTYHYKQLAAPSNPSMYPTMYLDLMTLDPKGNLVVSSQLPYSIVVFSPKGKMLRYLGGNYTEGDHFIGGATGVAFDPSTKSLFAAYLNDFSVVEYDYTTGKALNQIISGLSQPKAVAVSP